MRVIYNFQLLILLFLLVGYSSGTEAQINKVISNPESAIAPAFVKSGNNFVLYGTYSIGFGFQILYTLKTDSLFNTIKLTTHTDSINSCYAGYKNILKTNNGFVASFSTYDSVGNVITGLIFLNDSLQIQNILYYSSITGYLAGLNIIKHPDGGFIITGEVRESPPLAHNIFLLRTDSLGNELWRKTYGQPGVNESPGRAFHIQGEEYFVPYFKMFYYDDNQPCYQGYLLKLYSNGQFVSKKFCRDFQFEGAMNNIISTNDGNFIGTGIFSDGNDNSAVYNWQTKGRLTVIDSNMNVISDKAVGDNYSQISGFGEINQIHPNDYVISGGKTIPYNGYEIPSAWLLRYKNDTVQWQRFIYYYNSQGSLNANSDFLLTNDGGFAFCGYTKDANGPQQIWVVKTDSFGCVVPGCQMYDGLEINQSNEFSISIFPNPASDFLNIFVPPGKDREDVRIYDMQGKMVQSLRLLPAATTTMLNVRNLAPGMYFISHGGEAIKFVKE